MPKVSKLQKVLIFILLLVGLIPIIYFATVEIGIAQTEENLNEEIKIDDPIGRYVENLSFGINEKLSFDINYGFINAGTAAMEVKNIIEYEGRPCYQILSTANSNKFFSSFYKVDDRIETIVDAVGLFSWRFEKDLSEGSYKSLRQYSFDQINHTTVYKKDTFEVAPYVQDALSMLYYARTQPLEVGKSLWVDNFIDGKVYKTEIKVLKKETVDVEAGEFDCLVVEPLLNSAGVFKHEGSLKVWMTDDKLKMPVMMKSKVLVGSITAELTDFEIGEIIEF